MMSNISKGRISWPNLVLQLQTFGGCNDVMCHQQKFHRMWKWPLQTQTHLEKVYIASAQPQTSCLFARFTQTIWYTWWTKSGQPVGILKPLPLMWYIDYLLFCYINFLAACYPSTAWTKIINPQLASKYYGLSLFQSMTVSLKTSWRFQAIWKISVKLGIFPK